MSNAGNFKVTTPTDREIVITRVFDAPRRLVFFEHGVAAAYDRLEQLLASPAAEGA
jgi:hypothetical protein